MYWLNGNRMRLAVVGIVAAMVVGGGSVKADFTFGEPTHLGATLNTSSSDWPECISADGLEMYICSGPDNTGYWDIWLTKRATIDDFWSPLENLGPPINSPQADSGAHISPDGKTLYFASNRLGGNWDIWMSKRQTKDDPWEEPVNLGAPVNSSQWEGGPRISTDGLELYFSRYYAHKSNIWLATRSSIEEPWSEPVNLSTVNTGYWEEYPRIPRDGLLLFHSDRPDGYGDFDIWMTTRTSKDALWTEPVNLGPNINTPYADGLGAIAPDGKTLYFNSTRPGGLGGLYGDIWQASILPIVDLNSDGIVDSADMCIIVDHWGENYPLCDIGPTPFGDGIVDVQDLIVLAEHLFEDYRLIAYWKFNETEGNIAYDSSGSHDADLVGDPVWNPSGGRIDGALEFDGIDDYVKTPFVLTPPEGSFSVFAWIQGGVPGQVIISEKGRNNWLMGDLEGNLATPIMSAVPADWLHSQTQITDGQWHHVGLLWDNDTMKRTLYVDSVEVAGDKATYGQGTSHAGLHIGASNNLHSSSFWSGLIDDVRIYNRIVSP